MITLKNYSHFNKCAVFSHHSFKITNHHEYLFKCLFATYIYVCVCVCVCVFDEMSVQIFCPFFIELLVFFLLSLSVLYRFWVQVLYQMCSLANIFTQSVACLFIYLTVSFGGQKS
jgi:hypothetical protein